MQGLNFLLRHKYIYRIDGSIFDQLEIKDVIGSLSIKSFINFSLFQYQGYLQYWKIYR